MPRPSLKKQRRTQIIDAAMNCVAAFGVRGLTLDKVADFAGLARPLIRHNVGNREELISAVLGQYFYESTQKMTSLLSSLPPENPLDALIEAFFDPQNSDTRLMLVAEALIAEGTHNKAVAQAMREWLDDYLVQIDSVVTRQLPALSKSQCRELSAGLTGIYFTVDSMSPLGAQRQFVNASKNAALALLKHYKNLIDT